MYTACTEINLANTALGPSAEGLFTGEGGTSYRAVQWETILMNCAEKLVTIEFKFRKSLVHSKRDLSPIWNLDIKS